VLDAEDVRGHDHNSDPMNAPLSPDQLAQLVGLICAWAATRDDVLTLIRIVKFLYLADLYYARKRNGETLTGWTWRFVHFGPYCQESLVTVDRAVALGLIDKNPYTSSYTGEEQFIYRGRRLTDEPQIERVLDSLSTYLTSTLKAAVKKWADDTAGLLTHVYFETEPMQGIEPQGILDFRKAQAPKKEIRVPAMKLSTKQMKQAKEALESLRRRTLEAPTQTPVDTGPKDAAYLQAVDVEDLSDGTPEFSGVVTFGDLRQPDPES
jgi:hypothetical protein